MQRLDLQLENLSCTGHTHRVMSVAYSPDGRHITSRSSDNTVQIWDVESGSAVGMLLEGHTDSVLSVAYSSNGRRITSGSSDSTIQMWDAKSRTRSAVGNQLEAHAHRVQSTAYSTDCWNVLSASTDKFSHLSDPVCIQPIDFHRSPNFRALPGPEGWVRDPEGGLLYWVPFDCRIGLHSPAFLTIPRTSHTRTVSLDFKHFVFGAIFSTLFGPNL